MYPRHGIAAFPVLKKLRWIALEYDGLDLLLLPTLEELSVAIGHEKWVGLGPSLDPVYRGNGPLPGTVISNLAACDCLHTVTLPTCDPIELMTVVNACPQLHTLQTTWHMISRSDLVQQLWQVPQFRQIRSHDAMGTGSMSIVADFDNAGGVHSLNSLQVMGEWGLLTGWLKGLPDAEPHSFAVLFEFAFYTNMEEDIPEGFRMVMEAITERFARSLHHFRLEQPNPWLPDDQDWHPNFHDLLQPIWGLPELRSLSIHVHAYHNLLFLDDHQIATALPHWPLLERFSLSVGLIGCSALTGESLLHFCMFCPSLQVLEIPLSVRGGEEIILPPLREDLEKSGSLTVVRLLPALDSFYTEVLGLRSRAAFRDEACQLLEFLTSLFPCLQLLEYRRPGLAHWNALRIGRHGALEMARQRLLKDGLEPVDQTMMDEWRFVKDELDRAFRVQLNAAWDFYWLGPVRAEQGVLTSI